MVETSGSGRDEEPMFFMVGHRFLIVLSGVIPETRAVSEAESAVGIGCPGRHHT